MAAILWRVSVDCPIGSEVGPCLSRVIGNQQTLNLALAQVLVVVPWKLEFLKKLSDLFKISNHRHIFVKL